MAFKACRVVDRKTHFGNQCRACTVVDRQSLAIKVCRVMDRKSLAIKRVWMGGGGGGGGGSGIHYSLKI